MTSTEKTVNCIVDKNVLNSKTFPDFVATEGNIGLWVFAPLCGRNRGAFVLDPPDGDTYSCAEFPKNFHTLAGVKYDNITSSNSIEDQFNGGNITASEAVDLVDVFVQAVFGSSPDNDKNPMACAVNGLAKLTCNANEKSAPKIRAVTLAGALTPAAWLNKGEDLTFEQAKAFYTSSDFADMKKLGLNAVQIPVPLSIFDKANSDGAEKVKLLGSLMSLASDAELGAIVVLANDVDDEEEVNTVQAAAAFVKSQKNLVALVVPSSNLVSAARIESTTLPLMIPTTEPELPFLTTADPNIMAAFDRGHTTSVADIASSESADDRNKLYYHEMVACQSRSAIEYSACYRGVPAYVFNGFNLAVDNCIDKNSVDFFDYGQCGRFNETIDSGWWHAHRKSFAKRQLAAFETGAGWTFDAWKLYKEDPGKVDMIDEPAKLWTLKNVAAAGLLPSLTDASPGQHGCLNPPVNDVVLGDDTLAPTAGPPPACKDNGWWSEEKGKCEFWIPPTACPTPAPIPECEHGGYWSPESQECEYCPKPLTAGSQALAATGGAVIAVVLGAVFIKLFGRRRGGYSQVPNAELTV